MKTTRTLFLAASIASLVGVCPARANLIFQTYDGTTANTAGPGHPLFWWMDMSDPSAPFFYGNRVAVSFTTDNRAYTLNWVKVNLNATWDWGAAENVFRLSLYGDLAGVPEPPPSLEAFPDLYLPWGVDLPQDNYTFPSSGTLLSANTTYWIVGEAVGLTTWYRSKTVPGYTYAAPYNHLSPDPFGNPWIPWDYWQGEPNGPAPAIQVDATPVPEVSGWAAMGAILCLGSTVVRRGRSAAGG